MDVVEMRASSFPGCAPIEIIVDTPRIMGLGSLHAPTLMVPIRFRCERVRRGDQEGPVDYVLPELRGYLGIHGELRLAELRSEPNMIESRDYAQTLNTQLYAALDSKRIALMEKHRSDDMELRLEVWGTAFVNKAGTMIVSKFQTNNPLELRVPQSTWVGNVLNKWKLAQTHLVEIQTEASETEIVPAKAIEHLRSAEGHFLHHKSRETMASLYSAFEAVAVQRGRQSPDKDFFADLLSALPDDMRAKYRDLFRQYCITLHLGRHESGQDDAQQVSVEYRDAQLALILGQAILSYLSKLS